jgi:hypothetical protein
MGNLRQQILREMFSFESVSLLDASLRIAWARPYGGLPKSADLLLADALQHRLLPVESLTADPRFVQIFCSSEMVVAPSASCVGMVARSTCVRQSGLMILLFVSLLAELLHVEACKETALSYQFYMGSPLNNPSFVQHQNLIRSQHC